MKAISLWQPWASAIAYRPEHTEILRALKITAQKTIETRKWYTRYRGDLVICSTKNPKVPGLPMGMAVCIVKLADCRRMKKSDELAAQCGFEPGRYAWILENIRPIEPFPQKGAQGFFEVDVGTLPLPAGTVKQLVFDF